MATLRLLLALSLIALGTTGAAFAISGYFDPRQWPQEAKGPAEAGTSKLDMGAMKVRQRFVAIEAKAKPAAAAGASKTAPPAPAKATTAVAKAPAKKLPPAKDGKEGNVQQAAAWWPLANLFKN
ncbi:MAG TPA: hypothetical protein VFR00_14645 [Hyphomicrobiaceae bacterium]|jgi:hypothetical protein|nr:hypothetical protein [Hyphomicrobiaceae bacterium]